MIVVKYSNLCGDAFAINVEQLKGGTEKPSGGQSMSIRNAVDHAKGASKMTKDITGNVFGRLRAIAPVGKNKNHRILWQCICECGTLATVDTTSLMTGNTKSCGCLQADVAKVMKTTHGGSGTAEYITWTNMKARCFNPNSTHFGHYGGRGITICDRWLSFKNFYADMGNKPTKKHTIERINNDAGYFFDNCKWATRREQCNNKRSNRYIEHEGQTLTMSQWARKIGLAPNTLKSRLYSGWSTERAINTPKLRTGSNKK